MGIDDPSSEGQEHKSTGTKLRFDDTEYLEQSREIVDSVKSAVAAGMYIHHSKFQTVDLFQNLGLLKKRKKAKTTHQPSEGTPTAAAS